MPAAEVDVDEELVQALLAAQHPDLAGLPLRLLANGWDNVSYRLGTDLVVRLPRREVAAVLLEHEQRWLPVLAPRLPLPIPAPVRIGRPQGTYPWSWSVVPWLVGESAAVTPLRDPTATAAVLGGFLRALHQPAPGDAPRNPWRGVALAERAPSVYERAKLLAQQVDTIVALWEGVVRTPPWPGPAVWLHGDLHPGNILVRNGCVSAVLDFGDLTSGDPATDLSVAWMLLPPSARAAFRASSREASNAIDDDTWMRARGWALALGLVFLAARDDAVLTAVGRVTIDAVLSDDALTDRNRGDPTGDPPSTSVERIAEAQHQDVDVAPGCRGRQRG